MIDYYDFKKYMTKIEEFNILCNKLYDIGFGSEPLWEYIATIIDLLEIIVNDKYEWISWYCWDCDFGTDTSLFPKEDKDAKILSYEWLYNKIKESQDVN